MHHFHSILYSFPSTVTKHKTSTDDKVVSIALICLFFVMSVRFFIPEKHDPFTFSHFYFSQVNSLGKWKVYLKSKIVSIYGYKWKGSWQCVHSFIKFTKIPKVIKLLKIKKAHFSISCNWSQKNKFSI